MILERIELESMPFDMTFETENGKETCHATGYEVVFDGDDTTWIEYIDSCGDLHYGR